MRKMAGLGAAMMIGAAGVGCQPQHAQQEPAQTATARGVLDVTPVVASGPRYAAPTRGPAVVPPVEPTVPLITTVLNRVPEPKHASPSPDPASATPAAAHIAKSAYKVKKGDTLFRIAKTSYGDGKQWTRIASANPGLSPTTLKVGQSIVVP